MARLGDLARWLSRNTRRVAVATVGCALVLGGVVLLVLPGPGLLVIITGLAVLATEFAWAKSALRAARRKADQAGTAMKRRTSRQ